jgi:type III pantothenate kinase
MLLAVDIGNTNTVFGFFDDDKLAASFRIATGHAQTSDECAALIRQFQLLKSLPDIDSMVIATVVPKFEPIYRRMVKSYFEFEPLFVTCDVKLNVAIDYPRPSEIGADRICNAVAAFDRYGGPSIVVDFGTATTFDIITAGGAYCGGVIAPGIESSQAALSHRAAQLFKVSIQKPSSAIGKSTDEAMVIGSFYGAIGQTDLIIEKITADLGGTPKVIATGGLAQLVSADSRYISEVDPDITLRGLQLIHRLNRSRFRGAISGNSAGKKSKKGLDF